MPTWWNGIHSGFKTRRQKRESSTLSVGTGMSFYQGARVVITGGPGAGQWGKIVEQTGTCITVDRWQQRRWWRGRGWVVAGIVVAILILGFILGR